MKKNIVFITNSIGFGGAEKMLVYVANCLAGRGHKCIIINLNTFSDYINAHQQKISDKINLITVPAIPHGKNKNVYRIKQIFHISKTNAADILIGFTGFPNLYATVVGKLLHVPSVICERGDPNRTKADSLIKEVVSKTIINSSNGAVFQTPGAMQYYGHNLKKRGIVIPNPIYLAGNILYSKEKEKSVVSVGRFDNQQKRYDVMINAFAKFSRIHPEYVLKLYGKGSDENIMRTWINENAITDKVIFMGVASSPMQEICNDGMFVISSDYEGISNSLLEAMAVGLPCISTDHSPGGGRFLIQDHVNGLLVPTGDVQKLSNAMCEFAEDMELAYKCGENAKYVIDRFAPDHIIDMWESYIEKVCE